MGSRFRLINYIPAGRVTVSYDCGAVTVQANQRCSTNCFEPSGWLFFEEIEGISDI